MKRRCWKSVCSRVAWADEIVLLDSGSSDYILMIDVDECVSPELRHSIGQCLQQPGYAQVWAMQHHQRGKSCSFFSIISHTLGTFFKTWILRAGFLDGK